MLEGENVGEALAPVQADWRLGVDSDKLGDERRNEERQTLQVQEHLSWEASTGERRLPCARIG